MLSSSYKCSWAQSKYFPCSLERDIVSPRVRIADAHRGDGKRYVVRADEKLTAFVGLESAPAMNTEKALMLTRKLERLWPDM
jgi:hypothetical protein